ncbi:hypothetical protein KC19_VG001300 [Ceratodon purpureus]|uniref:Uncharacterized protein n=1 Tax=Ceratodon purpureus TaxID=3225 RepID=A0A8T0HKD9_CERPU|nr:hypothetical protein KC19_6G223000 [Ceratodon purpureus]KAG0571313.1 hypothetical protein KC19_VG001300 [Ceratodon purpureus]
MHPFHGVDGRQARIDRALHDGPCLPIIVRQHHGARATPTLTSLVPVDPIPAHNPINPPSVHRTEHAPHPGIGPHREP